MQGYFNSECHTKKRVRGGGKGGGEETERERVRRQPGIDGEKQSREIHGCTSEHFSGLLCVQVMGFEEGKLLSKNMNSNQNTHIKNSQYFTAHTI